MIVLQRDVPELSRLTREAFGNLGDGFEQNKVQLEYAQAVANTLSYFKDKNGNATLGFLQGETGVGKTLGYLIPLLLRQAITGERVAISTFTISLQSQIMREGGDMDVAVETVARTLGRTYAPKVRVRKDLGSFVSRTKTRNLRQSLLHHHGNQLSPDVEEFFQWAEDSPSGDLQEWTEMHGSLPMSIYRQQVALSVTDSEEDKAAYRKYLEAAKMADVVVMDHSVAMNHQTSRLNALDRNKSISVIVFDEADRVADCAKYLRTNTFNIAELLDVAKALDNEVKSCKKAIKTLKSTLNKWIEHGQGRTLAHLSDSSLGQKVMDDLQTLHGLLSRATPKDPNRLDSIRKQELVADMRDRIDNLKNLAQTIYAPSSEVIPIIRWSPTKRYPTIQAVPVQAGQAIRPYLTAFEGESYLSNAIFTSATLGVSKSAAVMLAPFGISTSKHRVAVAETFEPTKFGHLEFVLAGKDFPAPVMETGDPEDPAKINPEWYDAASRMIREAHRRGGRMLVLTPSYNDVSEFKARLSDLEDSGHLLAHERGVGLRPLVSRYSETENAILITPTGWEGLDLPNLVDNLVIARIPFGRPDDVQRSVMQKYYQNKLGISKTEASRKVFAHNQQQVINKLRKGINQVIRKKDSRATLWIADPRFPHPEGSGRTRKQQHSELVRSIPIRFRKGGILVASPWDQAEIFTLEEEPA